MKNVIKQQHQASKQCPKNHMDVGREPVSLQPGCFASFMFLCVCATHNCVPNISMTSGNDRDKFIRWFIPYIHSVIRLVTGFVK